MVRSCSVYHCKSNAVQKGKLSFHLFPTDPDRRNLWTGAIKQARNPNLNFQPGKFSYVCSKHFTKDSFVKVGVSGPLKVRTLKRDAFPTIFYTPSPKKKSLASEEPSTIVENTVSIKKEITIEEHDLPQIQIKMELDDLWKFEQ